MLSSGTNSKSMSYISKFGASLLIILINFSCVSAQADLQKLKESTPQQRADFQTKLMKAKLNLNQDQLTKVSSVNLKYAQKFEPVLKSDENRFSKMRQAKALMEQKDKELQIIFTKSQYTQYLAFEQDMRKKLREQMKDQN